MNDRFYRMLDQPGVLMYLFHPRPEPGGRPERENRKDLMIDVEAGVQVGGSFHFSSADVPVILFFHGNGEIVSDYDDLGILFTQTGLNFFVVDYRGYGSSDGTPTVSDMIRDAHMVFDFVRTYMFSEGLTGPLCVMGRSLGSASALELAKTKQDQFSALIIESGFAWMKPLLRTLGVFLEDGDKSGHEGVENIDKIKSFLKPCLIIHAQYDHIIPFSDGQALFDACPSDNKKLLEVKGANHNDIFLRGMNEYLAHLKDVSSSLPTL